MEATHPGAMEGVRARERQEAGIKHGVWGAIEDRLGLRALSYPVPAHANGLLYTLGGITFITLLVLVATGVLLAQFYNPSPDAATDSVGYIMTQVPLGDFLRGIHFWSANLLVVLIILHVVRVFVTGAHKAPREVNWLVGLGLLAVVIGFLFTGTVLKWDQEAYEAMQHNKEAAELLGTLGAFFSGGFTSSVPLIVRLYVAHIAMLPVLLVFLAVAHFFLIKHHGMAPLPSDAKAARTSDGKQVYGESLVPYNSHVRTMVGWGLVAFAIVAAVAFFLKPELGPKPTPGIEVTKPMWMFLWLYSIEDWLGIRGLIYAPVALFALLAVVPFIDRGPLRSPLRRKGTMVYGALLLLVLVGLVIYAEVSTPVAHTLMGGM